MPLISDVKPFVLDFGLIGGFCTDSKVKSTQRRMSDMVAQFANEMAAQAMVEGDGPLLYEFYDLDSPKDDSDVLRFGTIIFYPGRVGEEYFMTKGRFYTILDTFEIYYGLSGHGTVLMETPEGQVDWKEIGSGETLYVPGRWAHYGVNTGVEPLMMFFVYRGDAGHGYDTIEEKGHRKLVVERDGKPVVIDNFK